ncbi:ATP-binding cassette sub-family D member 3-like [Oppia nitens]|uniref:ATP-binding cassette sub-family D member 3-like n=1 Tax=Oppia nitens TaxID=1686743 RepID=UPI0023DC3E28|nr:ATP-binding cassette sub-family D member 3-like [Oppia nitens]
MTLLSKLVSNQSTNGLDAKRVIVLTSSVASLVIWVLNMITSGTKSRQILTIDGIGYTDKTNTKTQMESLTTVIKNLKTILRRILGPKEYTYVLGIAASLVVRTMCDLWLIQNGTQIEAAIITANVSKLKSNLLDFLISMPILAFVNNSLKYCINQLRLGLRYRLSHMLYHKYTTGLTYYRLNVLDNQCQNIDQLMTNDVEKFCNTIVDVYSNVSKPILDILILVQRLTTTYTGISTPASMIGYLIIAGTILTNSRRPMTKMTVTETQLEGELRYVHNKIIANCEEIAFYQGNVRERVTLINALTRLTNHLSNVSIFKFNIEFLDNIVAKYLATICGYLSLSIPFLTARYSNNSQAFRLETYYKSGRMMVKLAESIGRLVMAGRDYTRLAAYTTRVYQLINNIEHIPNNTLSIIGDKLSKPLIAGSGVMQICDPNNSMICFTDVPLCTPNGEVLVTSIDFTLKIGQNVIITGPNGCGKSSLFRLLGGLWPLFGGKLVKPPNNRLFYIPQRPYMTIGTFRDQVIYPDSTQDMKEKGVNDNHLLQFLKIVQIEYLLERESWDSVHDWQEVLSGGEKQRIALSRLLYHKPLFAILDECTSAVSIDVEQNIYDYLLNSVQCSLLSVTHRVKQLQQFHHFILEFDGFGQINYRPLVDEDSVLL